MKDEKLRWPSLRAKILNSSDFRNQEYNLSSPMIYWSGIEIFFLKKRMAERFSMHAHTTSSWARFSLYIFKTKSVGAQDRSSW